jgi:hypothetical protein
MNLNIKQKLKTTQGNLMTQRFGVKPICYENVLNTITYIQGLYLYPVTA